ncbi:hypothetical protein HMPREF0693_2965 [Proteus mirabilis ATCC 29906]|nr:hypothetical protein HMPREF0693_2965 [Proteus mirabilis ATCC 29906]
MNKNSTISFYLYINQWVKSFVLKNKPNIIKDIKQKKDHVE